MNQGKIVEYIDQGRFVCALCLQDKGNKLHLLTPTNRLVNLSPKRALLISGSATTASMSREQLLEELNRTETARNLLKEQINVKDLWDLIRDEQESFDHRYLTHLVFGEAVTDDHLSAVVRALFDDRLYFRLKEGRFLPNTLVRVNQIVKQREEEALREELLTIGSSWLSGLHQGRERDDPACKENIINLLIQLAVYGKESPDFKYGKELLLRAGISDIREARNLLIRMDVWEEDENLDLLRLAIEPSFTPKQLEESTLLAGKGVGIEGRTDLRDLPVLTIDGPHTRDYDDALSLEIDGDILKLGIHITDVAAAISPDSILDRQARERASSLYLQRRQIPMIPPELSQNRLCLKKGCDREAISLLAGFDMRGNLLDYRFVPSVIRVRSQLNYDEVNEVLNAESPFHEMYELGLRLRRARMDRGALAISLPDLQFSINSDRTLSLELIDQNIPSRMIIAEFMILYNWLAGRFCKEHNIPVLFRTQNKPNETFTMEEGGFLFYVFQQRRKLSPLRIDTRPNPHSGLGLDAYTQSTSPLRRYLDLVAQRQMAGFLMESNPPYDEKKLEAIRLAVEPVLRDLQAIKRNRLRYWTLRFLNQHRGEKLTALILDELKRKYRIVLNDSFLVAEIKRRDGIILKPGEEILVEVRKAYPWDNVIELAYAEE